MLRSLLRLRGYPLGAIDGRIGGVRDYYFNDSAWMVRYLVVDTGQWLPGRLVLIEPKDLGHPDFVNRVLPVNLTKRDVQNSPSIDTDKPVSRQREVSTERYYGWPMYWSPIVFPSAGPVTPVAETFRPSEPMAESGSGTDVVADRPCDIHLRSVLEVIGYRIEANDGRFGHVEDFIINDEGWAIQYIVIDIKNWLPSRKVLMLPMYVADINWDQSIVRINAPRKTIMTGPVYSSSAPINREYELANYDYYGRSRGRQRVGERDRGMSASAVSSPFVGDREAG